MATVAPPDTQRFVLDGVDWRRYLGFDALLDDRRVRLTYNRGSLEFMTLSYRHENLKEILGDLIVVLCQEFGVPRNSAGSMTFRREDLNQGLEPDQCYYLTNAHLVRGQEEIDLQIDPPPDLAIEIEVSRSLLDRIGILAAIEIPEVWRCDGETLRFLRLNERGGYDEASESRYFPGISPSDVMNLLRQRSSFDEDALLNSFREMVRRKRGSQDE